MYLVAITFTASICTHHTFLDHTNSKSKSITRRVYKTQATLQATAFGPKHRNRAVNWDHISRPKRNPVVAVDR